jgi:hypothetical protein
MNPQDDDNNGTDPLQPKDDIFNPATDEQRLPEDNSTPAAPADDVPSPTIPVDYPATDDSVDEHETYEEGLAHASGVGEQEVGPENRATPLELNHQGDDQEETEEQQD